MQNLTQLGAALQNYEMAHEVYPPGTIDKQGPIQSVAPGGSPHWLIHILPYIEDERLSAHRSSGWRVRIRKRGSPSPADWLDRMSSEGDRPIGHAGQQLRRGV